MIRTFGRSLPGAAERCAPVFLPAWQPHKHLLWYLPDAANTLVFPAWRHLGGYLSAIARAPIPSLERWRCYAGMPKWVCRPRRWRELAADLVIAARHLLGVRGFKTIGDGQC